ncbi:MAG: GHKL domain-containing protein [Lachnospiraceae bacterium]|jgi:hypothetical protein|nr:GHKL domain-containing protein [Lachnospiraceae bacterium]
MNLVWIAIETSAVIVDGLTKAYFLDKRYTAKSGLAAPRIVFLLALIVWGMMATFLAFAMPLYEFTIYAIVAMYLYLFKQGSFSQKVFGVFLVFVLDLGSSLLGISAGALITGVSMKDTLIYQDGSRLLAIVLSQTIKIVLYCALAQKRHNSFQVRSKPLIALGAAVLPVFSCLLFLFLNLSDFDERANHIMLWQSLGLMVIMVGIFLMYEVFMQEGKRIADLTAQLQRLEIETGFFRELDAMQSDLRTWRHEYQNNLIALRALAEDGEHEKVLEYLDSISIPSQRDETLLQTGNSVLDAVVSSKLLLARSKGIEVSLQAVYPEEHNIEDGDFCAIIGNLLDNAIDANERIGETECLRFISFSLLVKGKNLAISIINSYEGEIVRVGDHLPTVKDERYHGIGIRYVDAIVDKYHGHVLREYQDGIFETHIMIPLIIDPRRSTAEVAPEFAGRGFWKSP